MDVGRRGRLGPPAAPIASITVDAPAPTLSLLMAGNTALVGTSLLPTALAECAKVSLKSIPDARLYKMSSLHIHNVIVIVQYKGEWETILKSFYTSTGILFAVIFILLL